MVRESLIANDIPKKCTITRMEGELSDREVTAFNFEQALPESIDILLVSLGTDGELSKNSYGKYIISLLSGIDKRFL